MLRRWSRSRSRFFNRHQAQAGVTLIEVLVAVLLLSFGLLSLSVMLSYSVQMPKLSGYRAIATNLASSHIARILANPGGFANKKYQQPLHDAGWSFDAIALANCAYHDPCTESSLATMDDAAIRRAVRMALPAGDMLVNCDAANCSQGAYGNLWIVWQEPSSYAPLDATSSDNCPAQVKDSHANPKPRCLYVRFKL